MRFLSWLRSALRPSFQRQTRSLRRRPAVEQLETREVPSGNSFLFDFGKSTSPVAPGYTQVALTPYSAGLGYGWDKLDGMYAGDNGTTDPLTRDFNYGLNKAGSDRTFQTDLANGTYDVTILLGGRSPQDRVDIYAEGQKVGSQLSVGYMETLLQTYRVAVADGRLDVRFVDTGGVSRYWAVSGMQIVPVFPTLALSGTRVTEGDTGTTKAVFSLTLSQPYSQPVTVSYATADGTATTADGDYVAASGTVTFAPGQTSQTITVAVNGDFRPESNEDFFVNLSSAVNATLASSQAEGVVIDDDQNNILIDSNWLAQRGAGPYLLDQAGMTYVLMTDVRTAGTAFVGTAANVTLNLNSHTVTYGDSTPATVVNAGFEQGTGTSVPGWDLSGAPAAALAPNTRLLFGNQVLRVSNFTTAQRIVSDPISIPLAGHTYTASITPANPNSKVFVTISVIDTATGQVLGSGTSDSAARGFSALAHFTATTTNPVRLQIDVASQYGNTQSVDLDQATLTVSGDYGIMASHAWSGDILGYSNFAGQVGTAYKNASGFTVKNGFIVQGQGDGYGSSPLYFRGLAGVAVDGVETHATGLDTQSLEASYATVGVTVRNSTFREDIDNISDRMNNFATLKLNSISGPIVVQGNHLLGSPQIGIMLAGNDPQYPVSILNNEIRQNAVVTNGYAILFSTVQNFTIASNTIIPTNGKGISLDGYKPYLMANGAIRNNYVEVQERVNREYPTDGVEAVALRLRNSVDGMGPQRDISVHDNTFIARTGPALVREAHAVRISYVNNNGAMNDAGISLVNNLIKAIVTTTDTWWRGRALMLDRVDAGIGLHIAGNVLESNDTSLALTNDTTGGVNDVDLFSNTLRKSSEGPARTYTGILAGYYNREIHDVRIFDTRLENGATASIVFAGTGLKDLSVGWLLDLKVQDAAGNPLSGAAVSVLDRVGTQVYSGTTGADGWVHGIPVVTTVYQQTTTDPRQIIVDDRGPFSVQASFGGTTISQDVLIAASLELVLTVS